MGGSEKRRNFSNFQRRPDFSALQAGLQDGLQEPEAGGPQDEEGGDQRAEDQVTGGHYRQVSGGLDWAV